MLGTIKISRTVCVIILTLIVCVLLFPEISKAQWVKKWEIEHNLGIYHRTIAGTDVMVAGTLTGDFKGDGNKDIIVYDSFEMVIHNGQTGQVEFTFDWDNNPPYSTLITDPIVSDLDKDGRDELVLSFSDRTIAYEYIGQGTDLNKSQILNVPKSVELFQNYPNPFNPSTKINYSIKEPGEVKITIFNEVGQQIRTLVDEAKSPGNYTIAWDGMDSKGNHLSSGLYFYQLKVGNSTSEKKMLLLK
jgi:hypothetical protein